METKKHRHFVAIPLAAFLILAVAGIHAVTPVGATSFMRSSSIQFKSDETPLDFQAGWIVSGSLGSYSEISADTTAEHLELLRGQVLLQSAGLTHLTLGSLQVHALKTSYVALRTDSSVTVAPLTAPLIVTTGNETIVIVPGIQLSVDASGKLMTAAVPPDWYRERMNAAKLLPDTTIPFVDVDSKDLQISLVQSMTNGRIRMDTFLQAVDDADALDPTGLAARLLFLRLLQEDGKTDQEASIALSRKILEDTFLSKQLVSRLPKLISTLLKPASPAQIVVWEKSAVSLGLTNIPELLKTFHDNAHFPEYLARAGYPQQSLLWQRAFLSVASTLSATLSGQQLADLQADVAIITRGNTAQAEVITQKKVVYIPATNWSEEQLVFLVRKMLVSHGVLMTTLTVIAPDTPTQTVSVKGIFIAENGTDTPYALTVDVARGRITNIVRNGKKLPNDVSADVFFR